MYSRTYVKLLLYLHRVHTAVHLIDLLYWGRCLTGENTIKLYAVAGVHTHLLT